MTTTGGMRNQTRTYLVALFVIYLFLLTWIVLWKLEIPWIGPDTERVIKLVPFASTTWAGASPSLEVLVNFMLFVPFGVYLGLLARSWPWWKAAGVVAGTSLLFEAAQYVFAVGRSDVTDIIVNTAGGLAGMGLVALVRYALRARTVTVMAWACTAGTALVVVASGLFITSPLHFR